MQPEASLSPPLFYTKIAMFINNPSHQNFFPPQCNSIVTFPLNQFIASNNYPQSHHLTMSCFNCMSPRQREAVGRRMSNAPVPLNRSLSRFTDTLDYEGKSAAPPDGDMSESSHRFTLKELSAATHHFKETNLIGEGGFGKVYRGYLPSGQVVAIKQLNRDGMQGCREFLVECLMLIMLHHPNLVSLIGYCAQGDERLLVYEYMSQGSLERHMFDLPPDKEPLGWNTRVKIALGVAKGLSYLHNVAKPPVIYRDLKAANILLDDDFNPKLSDFGLAKLGPVGGNTHVSTRVMGTYGYCAPDYAMSGKLTVKSDIYSFGVLLLELITGRKAVDFSKPMGQQSLVVWTKPFLKERRKFTRLADPLLRGRFPLRAFCKLTMVAMMCLNEQPHIRPASRDLAFAIEHVATEPYVDPETSDRQPSSAHAQDSRPEYRTRGDRDDGYASA